MSTISQQLRDIQTSQTRLLLQLPAELGYDSPKALADAILTASNTHAPVKRPVADPVVEDGTPKGAGRKGRRISEEVRNAIRAALKKGDVPGNLIAKNHNVSYNIVHALKVDMGLVKSSTKPRGRRKKA